jgi:hypothetical protein
MFQDTIKRNYKTVGSLLLPKTYSVNVESLTTEQLKQIIQSRIALNENRAPRKENSVITI